MFRYFIFPIFDSLCDNYFRCVKTKGFGGVINCEIQSMNNLNFRGVMFDFSGKIKAENKFYESIIEIISHILLKNGDDYVAKELQSKYFYNCAC